ncbi:MAG: hypothetical protein QNJ90_03555 [Planctomycetota bacterium]|nr:hypothetical protein [Planctomycetota bacterium]
MSRQVARIVAFAGVLLLLAAPLAAGEKPAPQDDAEQVALQKLVDEIRPQVAKLRGLEWKHDVPVRLLSREELREYMQKGMARDVKPEEWARDNRIVRRLGLLKEDEDLRDLAQLMLQEMVAGAYDPKTKRLVLTAGFEGKANIPTLVHELIHALEDQHLDLQKIEKPYREDDPDRQFAIRCLFEGSAEWARRRFETLRPDAAHAHQKQMAQNTAMQKGQARVMRTVPTHMLLSTMLHYRAGPNFVTHAVGDDYVGGMAKLVADPPVSQEQILHPHKWLGTKRDHPRRVIWGGDVAKSLGDGWTKLAEHSVGELDLAVYLDYFLGDRKGRLNTRTMGIGKFVDAMSNRAARGWDAGRAKYIEHPEHGMVVVHALAFDSPEDADEAARTFGAALRLRNADAWKGEGWTLLDDEGSSKRFDYRGIHGRGRILQRDHEVLILDGIAAERFDRAWAEVVKTSFEQREDDHGDEARDPFEGYDVVDRQRGLGLKLPAEGWEAIEGGRSPMAFATARKGEVTVAFIVVDQGSTAAGLPRVGRMVLGNMFNPQSVTQTRVMGQAGIQHPLPAADGVSRMHIAGDAARTYVVFVSGSKAALEKASEDIRRLLDGMPRPGAKAPAEGAAPAAGLRSIPGY